MTESGDYDWTAAPWFLDVKHAEYLWSWRYERDELEQAAAALKTLYTPTFCRDYLQTNGPRLVGDGTSDAIVRQRRMRRGLGTFILSLFGQIQLLPPEILAFGIDLARVLPVKPPRSWLDRLKEPENAIGTAFEMEIWANALREGLAVSRIPEQRRKTPDFIVTWNGCQIGIEAKDLATGEEEMLMHEQMRFMYPGPVPPDDRTYRMEAAAEILELGRTQEGREQFRQIIDEVAADIYAAADRLAGNGWPFGEHEVPGRGRIVIEPRPEDVPPGTRSVLFAPEVTPDRRARRVLGPLQNGAGKFREWSGLPGGHVNVIVIDISRGYDPDTIHNLAATEIRQNSSAYRRTDAVIFRSRFDHIDPDQDHMKTYQHFACFAIRLPWCALVERQLPEMACRLLASPHRLVTPIRHRGKPDLIPTVRESMQLYAVTVKIDPRAIAGSR